MKRKTRRILATVLLMTLVLVYGFGPALAQEQMKVNINTATLDELCTLKRIGPSYAQRIIDYRTENGPFGKPEDLAKVQGIGVKTVEANKDLITCE